MLSNSPFLMNPSLLRKAAFGTLLIGSLFTIRIEPLLSLLLLIGAPLAFRLSYRKGTGLFVAASATVVSAWLLPNLVSPTAFWLVLATGTALTVMLPSAIETMSLPRALRAVWKDLLLLTALFSVWPNLLRLPEAMHWGFFLPDRPSIYLYWGVVVTYVGIRLWSMQVGIWLTPSDSERSPHWRRVAMAGRVVIGVATPFLLIGPWMGTTARILILLAAIVWSVVRLLYYLRLALPHDRRFLIDLPMTVPAIVGVVGFLALALSGGSGGEPFGPEEPVAEGTTTGGPTTEVGQDAAVGAENTATTSEAESALGIGPLQEVDGYVRSDGTVVQPYVRTVPDGTTLNNLGT